MLKKKLPLGLIWITATALLAALQPITLHVQESNSPLTISVTQAENLPDILSSINQMVRDGRIQVTQTIQDPLLANRTHHRLTQFHENVRVIGGDLTVQVENGVPASAFGQIYLNINLDSNPLLSADEALVRSSPDGLRSLTALPELAVVFDQSTSSYRLVYELDTFGPDGWLVTHVDATTGTLVSERYGLRTQTTGLPCRDCAIGVGLGVKGDRKKISVKKSSGSFSADDGLRPSQILTYDLRGDWQRTLDVLLGQTILTTADLANDSDNDWSDGANVDAHVGAGWTLDYLYQRFGHQGIDGQGSPVVTLVHPIDRSALFTAPPQIVSLFHLNAFYCGGCGPHGMVVFGEGLPTESDVRLPGGETVDFFAAGIDVVAHELGHAVTDSSSGLIYEGESGALNEAFSDLIGAGTEFFMAETGRHPAEQADYLIGEDVVKPGGIRSLSDPLSSGNPDHYSIRFLGTEDNGGVHINSTIVSHVYFLAIEGGVNRTSGLTVTGLGVEHRELIEQIFFRTFSFLLPTNATFSIARSATLQSARDLSSDPAVEEAIEAAWTAVGVTSP